MRYLYILKCNDDTFYTGITTNIDRRLKEHNGELKGGAKYTRVRQPVELIYQVEFQNRSEASKEEWRIKRLSREQKKELTK